MRENIICKVRKYMICVALIIAVSALFIGCSKQTECDSCARTKTCSKYFYDEYYGDEKKLEVYLCVDCYYKHSDGYAYFNLREDNTISVIVSFVIFGIFIQIIFGTYWGRKTEEVVINKHYNENWFWKGFWRGQWAFNEALTLPDNAVDSSSLSNHKLLKTAEDRGNAVQVKNDVTSNVVKAEQETIELIKQYKELLDTGVITQEEFEAKKKELLG